MRVDLHSVTAFRGRTEILRDVTVALRDHVTTVMGPNGAGKTTLLQVLAGLVRHTGSLLMDDRPLSFPADLQRIGYAPQTIEWPGRLSVRDVCELAAYLRKVPPVESSQRVTQALQAAGLHDLGSHRVGTLSGGQRRRLSLAQALVHTPRLLLLDEPTSELDPLFCESFAGTLSTLSEHHQIVVTTHSLDDVARWPGAVLLISHGRVTSVQDAATLSPDERREAVRAAFHSVA
jgi:ABC-type multidrug transport system ATPase subunit